MSPLDYLYGRLNYERVSPAANQGAFRLQRMRHLLRLLGYPERYFQIVHVGGTKGKGSTCEMIATMLIACGYKVGLYTSPHLERLEERFRVAGQPCEASELEALVEAVRGAADSVEQMGEGQPTFFELTTAMAMEYFRRTQCTVAVIEVGLGGRLDSTNVCDPVVSVITSVGLDHQHILGDTHAQIAFEKAGIIKPGVPVVSGVEQPDAQQVIRQTAAQRGALLWQSGVDFQVTPCDFGEESSSLLKPFDFHAHNPMLQSRLGWAVGLEGRHQQINAGVALAVMDALVPVGLSGPLDAQRSGLAAVRCAGRVERFGDQPEILLDTAHNIDSVTALRAVLRDRPAGGKTVVVFGTSADKDGEAMLQLLNSVADHLFLTRYWSNPRWFDPVELARMSLNQNTIVVDQPADALSRAIQVASPAGRVVICGSFFLAAELRPLLRAQHSPGC